jgi:uncharacterized protein (DUF1499 family)
MSAVEEKSKSLNWVWLSCISLLLFILVWVGIRIALPDRPTIFAGTTPTNLGVSAGKLAACPNTPNCVSSQSQEREHYIEPFTYNCTATDAIAYATSVGLAQCLAEGEIASLQEIIANQPRTKIIRATDDYLYAQFTSKWMGYVDDVEFLINQDSHVIEVRSASRLGESDLGVNRQRIEKIRNELLATSAT